MTTARWVLAYDDSCGTCENISELVKTSSRGDLETASLLSKDVIAWRTETFGEDAPWLPSLFLLEDDELVRGWTGKSIRKPLLRAVGVRKALSIMRYLGEVRLEQRSPSPRESANEGRSYSRKAFLGVAAGLLASASVLSGRSPAGASVQTWGATQDWLRRNPGQITANYDELIAQPEYLRRAIFGELSPEEQVALWRENTSRFVARYSGPLNAEQNAVIDRSTLLPGLYSSGSVPEALDYLKLDGEKVFGVTSATLLLGILGEPDSSDGQRLAIPTCSCNVGSDYCPWRNCVNGATLGRCQPPNCCTGCGTLYAYGCNGCCGGC